MKLRSISRRHYSGAEALRVCWNAVRWCLLQTATSLFFLCPISDPTCLFTSDCSLLFVRWEKGRQESVQCLPQALENQKYKRLSQLITHINWLCWIINGKFITSTCFVIREQEVGCAPCRGKLSCGSIADCLTKQENQSDRLRGSPSVFPC